MPADVVALRDFELDELRFELRHAGRPVRVQPKVLRLLFYLVQHRERSVSAQELLRALWPGERVRIASIKRAIGGARRALGENAESQASIRTVRGHGYQFVRAVVLREQQNAVSANAPALHTTFVGRESVLEQLEERLAAASAGHGQCVLLSGEAGIGTTRLLQELGRRAAASGAHAWLGRCTRDEGAPALWPWTQILRAAAAELRPELVLQAMGSGAADIAGALPELRQLYPQLGVAPAIGSTAERFRFFDSLTCFLERLALERPVCVLLDDLQHADPLTLALVTFLARHLDRARVLLVLTLRASERADADCVPALRELRQLSTLCDIALSGLSLEELATWIARRTGSPASPERSGRKRPIVSVLRSAIPASVTRTARR